MAERYATRPSELLGVADAHAAFCVDEALFVRLALKRDEERDPVGDSRLDFRGGYGKPPPPEVLAQLPVIPNEG